MPTSVLIVEDEDLLGRNMQQYLQRAGHEAQLATTAREGLKQFELRRHDVVVLDYHLPDLPGLEVLERIRVLDPDARVVMVTGHGSISLAVLAMRAGSTDFLAKPVALSQLKHRVEQAARERRASLSSATPVASVPSTSSTGRDEPLSSLAHHLPGDSKPMQLLRHTLSQLLEAEAHLQGDDDPPPVLISGETGTGKEVVARVLHEHGPRRRGRFVSFNCTALPAAGLESEMFGSEGQAGLIEAAEGGTLFLDEIGDLDVDLQAKVLKLLQEKTVRRMGATQERRISVRVVAATHHSLEARVKEGRFRADLYYRLCVVQLQLPPLRERGEDILALARRFIEEHAGRYGKVVPSLSPAAQRALLAHPWPGNVRELRNVLEQAVLLNEGDLLDASRLRLSPAQDDDALPAVPPPADAATAVETATLPEVERQALMQVLSVNGWNVSRSARALGISRDMLRYRIEKHGLSPKQGASATPDMATLPEIERQAVQRALASHGWNVSRAARALGISRDMLRYRIEKHGLTPGPGNEFVDSE